jgi:hypothetical protein
MNQINFHTYILYVILSTFAQFVNMTSIDLISISDFLSKPVLPQSNKNTQEININSDLLKKINKPHILMNIFIIMSIFFLTMVNQHLFIEVGKISEKCKDSSWNNVFDIMKPYLLFISLVTLPAFINKYIFGNKKTNFSNKYFSHLINNPIIMYIILLIGVIPWTIYNIISKSNNQMPTSNPKYPYLSIIISSLIFSLIYFGFSDVKLGSKDNLLSFDTFKKLFSMKNFLKYQLMLLLYLALFSYSYVINVGGINYNCNN